MKINDKDVKEMFGEFFLKAKEFKFTKYLLNKKERKLQTSIELKEGLIEHWRQQIGHYQNSIVVNTNLIIQAEREIKELEENVKKVVKVINLYID